VKPKGKKPDASLAGRAYQMLYDGILRLEYPPGRHLEEKDLIQRLGIGRTPIREALVRLASELLLESLPNKGFVVRPITLQNTKAMFESLRIFELAAAGLALRQDVSDRIPQMEKANQKCKQAIAREDIWALVRANNEFHTSFAGCSNNEYLLRALRDVRHEADRLAYLSFGTELQQGKALADHYQTVFEQHKQIVEFLNRKDEKKLKRIINDHLDAFQQRIVLYLTTTSA
jgi:DNA-binding GntR family transcriptional regulator